MIKMMIPVLSIKIVCDDMDAGLQEVEKNVEKAVKIEKYLFQWYGIKLSNSDFDRLFDIIHE